MIVHISPTVFLLVHAVIELKPRKVPPQIGKHAPYFAPQRQAQKRVCNANFKGSRRCLVAKPSEKLSSPYEKTDIYGHSFCVWST
ncbi:MAG: hypothetical protein ABSG59_07515, partial [Verrucomicrobiota bacterium]